MPSHSCLCAILVAEHALPDDLKGAAVELSSYLAESFGNATRIDYGTGHETNFVVLLFCLAKLGVFSQQDRKALVLVIFRRYLDLVRRIQTTYWLEPAGSQGGERRVDGAYLYPR